MNPDFRMDEADAERSARRWKWIAVAAFLAGVCSLAALVAVVVFPLRILRVTDEQLLGTWQSDADRTIAGIRAGRPVDEKQETAFRKLFGKLRITWTPTTCMTELDGATAVSGYEVLGKDRHSVVIRQGEHKPSPMEGVVEFSEFVVIHFDGPDAYRLDTEIGGIREYF
jgi:hypothetical protein